MITKSSALALLTAVAITGCATREQPASVRTKSSVPTPPQASEGKSADNQSLPPPGPKAERTFTSFDRAAEGSKEISTRMIRFESADVGQVFALYELLSGRTLIRSPRVPGEIKITFQNASPLNQIEALQALDTVLAAQGLVMVYSGSKYVKACVAAEAPTEVPPLLNVPWKELPESMSYLTYVVQLRNMDATSATSALQPFARLPNSIIALRGNNILILRDYSSNVRRMVEMLERLESSLDAPGNAPK